MAVQQMQSIRPKAAVSVTTMARLVGMSRSRFYTYVKRGVFPWPIYSLSTRRPFFVADMQQDILAARQTGIGCNDEYVLFYEKQEPTPASAMPSRRAAQGGLLESLRSLGLPNLTQAQVDAAVLSQFPNGIAGIEVSALVRTLYRQLRRPTGG